MALECAIFHRRYPPRCRRNTAVGRLVATAPALRPDAVKIELERTFALLSMLPKVGAIAKNAKLNNVRRIHLAKITHHLYYRVADNHVEILALWHTSRQSVPGI